MGKSQYTSFHLDLDHKRWIMRFAADNDTSMSKAIGFAIDRLRNHTEGSHMTFDDFAARVRIKLGREHLDDQVIRVCYDVIFGNWYRKKGKWIRIRLNLRKVRCSCIAITIGKAGNRNSGAKRWSMARNIGFPFGARKANHQETRFWKEPFGFSNRRSLNSKLKSNVWKIRKKSAVSRHENGCSQTAKDNECRSEWTSNDLHHGRSKR